MRKHTCGILPFFAFIIAEAFPAAAANLEQTGTVQKTQVSDTDVYEPTQWNVNREPADGDTIQFPGYSSDKRFHLTADHANIFETLYFKTGHSAASQAAGSHLRFDTKGFSLLYPSSETAYGAKLRWQTYVPSGKSIAQGDHDVLSLERTGTSTCSALKMTDFAFHQYAYSDYATTVEFERGTLNAYDPEGTAEAFNSNVYTLNFATSDAIPTTVLLDPGVVFKVQRAVVANNGTSKIVLNGAQLHVNSSVMHRGQTVLTNGAVVAVGFLGSDGAGTFTQANGSLYLADAATTLRTSALFELKRGTVTNDSAAVTIGGDLFLADDTIGSSFVQNGGSTTVSGTYGTGCVRTELRVRGGEMSFAGSSGIYPNGGHFFVEGGTLTATRVRWCGAVSDETSRFVQSGGTIILNGSYRPGLWVCEAKDKQPCHLELLGGEIRTPTVNGKCTIRRGGSCKGSFLGNGGRLVATGSSPRNADNDNAPLFGWFDEAKIGAGGFTLDSNAYAVNVDQDFADADGENGVLVKAGVGTLTYEGACQVSSVRVTGGEFKLGSSATTLSSALTLGKGTGFSLVGAATSVTLSSLVATNAVLSLDPGDVITVNGPLAVENVAVAWSSEPTEFTTFLCVKGELSDETETAIRRMYLSGSAGRHLEFSFGYDAGSDVTSARAKVAENVPLASTAVWTGSGSWSAAANWQDSVKPDETRKAVFGLGAASADVAVAQGDTAGALAFSGDGYRLTGSAPLRVYGVEGSAEIAVSEGTHAVDCGLDLLNRVDVTLASGTVLALNGTVSGGCLAKAGSGRLTLGGTLAASRGFELVSGTVTATSPAALGATADDVATLEGGTLEIAEPNGNALSVPATVTAKAASAQKAVVYKTDTDVSFSRFGTEQGFLVKRGAGTMTVDVPAGKTVALTQAGSTAIGQRDCSTAAEGINFPEDGSEPTGMRGPLSVVEGELRLVGHGADSRVESPAASFVTVPTPGTIGADPSLTLRDVTLVCGELHNGWCLGKSPFAARQSTIRVLDSTLVWTSSMPGYACTVAGCHAVYAATNSVLDYQTDTGYLTRGRLDTSSTEPIVHYLLDHSSFYIGTAPTLDGSIWLDIDNGSYCGRKNADQPTATFSYGTAKRVYGEIFTHGGSRLALKPVTGVAGQTRDLTLAFDDGEWQWADDCGTAAVAKSDTGCVRYEMRGKGAVLKPAAGATLTVGVPFEGEGGLVVDGPGTIAFAAGACAFAGVADVRQGTLDLTAAGALSGKSFSGDGTIANGTLSDVTIAVRLSDGWANTNGVPVFSNSSLSGRVTVLTGRTDADPLTLPSVRTPTAIAKVAGTTTVDLGRWKLSRTGLRKASGAFTQVGDTIYLTPAPPPGFAMILK